MNKTYKCPYCKRSYLSKEALYDHMEQNCKDQLYGLPAAQVYFNIRNRYFPNKEHGLSVISGKITPFNLTTERYERFANEQERQQYREYFRQNMIKKYGKDTLLNDPEHQKAMLANRKISGTYTWKTGEETTYTGSFERRFLEYLDIELDWSNPADVMAPAPMYFEFKDDQGVSHFHIPDFYITSLNLIINIKSSENEHYRLRDIDRERFQDNAIKKSNFNYLKIYDNDFKRFDKVITEIDPDKKYRQVFIAR